jgi:hypothetical protein
LPLGADAVDGPDHRLAFARIGGTNAVVAASLPILGSNWYFSPVRLTGKKQGTIRRIPCNHSPGWIDLPSRERQIVADEAAGRDMTVNLHY